jgi:anthranilate synthase/phosphoribosyltransferase
MVLIIDNYDSFTYNLYQYLSQLYDGGVRVFRNDRIDIQAIERMNPEAIVISPGPGRPEEAGVSVEVIRRFSGRIPILGVCLGHQAIGLAFGGSIKRANRIVHGKTDEIIHDGKGLFRNIPPSVRFTRYHSLALYRETLPAELEITAYTKDGEIMGVRHREYTVEGIQFHPESIASEYGRKILLNFLHYIREPFSIPDIITTVLEGRELTEEQSVSIMEEITEGELTDAQSASFLTAMNTRPVTGRELYGFASVLNRKKRAIRSGEPCVDTCGTGGDRSGSFNISSMAALITSSCGATVAKHGNRSVSSRSGSADFYERLGIPIDLTPEGAEKLLEKAGFTFLFAPLYHRSMKQVAKVRRELGIRTVMNLLGPLVNPADASYQLIGVYDATLCAPVAEAAFMLGKRRVMVVHSHDGLDEISVCAPTNITEIDKKSGEVWEYPFHPEEAGVEVFSPEDLVGGTPEDNAEEAMALLGGGGRAALREAVCINAGAALYLLGKAESIAEGHLLAVEALLSGKTSRKLDEIRAAADSISREVKEAQYT